MPCPVSRCFCKYTYVKPIVLNISSASKLNGIDWLSEFVFSKFDLDDDGGLDMQEFITFYKEEDMMNRFYWLNRDRDEFVSLEEFLAYWAKCKCLPGNCS